MTAIHAGFNSLLVAILSCQLDYIWNELKSGNGGHTCKRFYA